MIVISMLWREVALAWLRLSVVAHGGRVEVDADELHYDDYCEMSVTNDGVRERCDWSHAGLWSVSP